jgi:o-succinylbenzoate---CoA ligase
LSWELGEVTASPLPQVPATLILTSGSTAQPKAVWHPLSAHLSAATASQSLLPIGPGSAWLLDLSLAHVSGLAIVFRCLQHGGTIIFPDKSATQAWPKGTTHLSVVAPQLVKLLELDWPGEERPIVLAGGGPFPNSLLRDALDRGWPIFLTYGMTETASQICTRRLEPGDVLPDRPEGLVGCGFPLPGWELGLSDLHEIRVRGANLAGGYFHPGGELRSITDTDGWFSTGDLGRFDSTAGWQVIGRKDRRFMSGGENIHPEVIEHHLEQIPGVLRARVVPRPDPLYGQRPVAFIAGELSPAKFTDILRSHLPKFCLPELYLPWPDHLDPDQAKLRDRDFLASLPPPSPNASVKN